MRHTPNRIWQVVLMILVISKLSLPAEAHTISFSHIDLRVTGREITATLEVARSDLGWEFPDLKLSTPGSTATPQTIVQTLTIIETMTSRFMLRNAGQALKANALGLEVLAKNVRLKLKYAVATPPSQLGVTSLLFPTNPLHKTFLNLYTNGKLERQTILDANTTRSELQLEQTQSTPAVIWQFLLEGVHHIFIGPDHILFVIGLLLVGGTLPQLLKIVSAFTISHSITLALATFNILNPPASLIEPAIAASIVFVGIHSLRKPKHDWRLWFALAFGLIHGFGFANALHEMQLPRAALTWSLVSFNLGVEFGQACIVLLVAPLLWGLRQRLQPVLAQRIVDAGSCSVIVMGAVWFFERVTSAV